MESVYVPTQRGPVLAGALFSASGDAQRPSRTVVIAITGIHGNFYSNPFYYNVGDTLNAAGIDFVYAQTCDAFGQMRSIDVHTEKQVLIGSWNERFSYTTDDVGAWVNYAQRRDYEHVVLAGHSLGANKVIRYLSETHDPRVDRFLLLSPCNVKHLTSVVTPRERKVVRTMVDEGKGQEMLPFVLLGWIECVADTAYDWLFSNELDNVHVEADADFSQVACIEHEGALLIGTYDTFTYGDPKGFLTNINDHFPAPERNKLVFIEGTGHTYQQKEQEMADDVLGLVQAWEAEGVYCGTAFLMSKESRMAPNVKQAVLSANAKDLLLFRTIPAYYRSLPGKLANELVSMDKAGATNEELGRKMGGFANLRIGMLEGDMDAGYVSVGNGISHIHEIKSCADIISELTQNWQA